jgi:hypothetical protein
MDTTLDVGDTLDLDADLGVGVVDIEHDGGVDVRGNPADLEIDTGVELEVTPSVDVAPDLRLDAGLDLGGALDAEPGIDLGTVDTGVDLTLDTGSVDVTLDAGGGALDLDLDVGGKADVELRLDLDAALRAPTRAPLGPRGGLPASTPLL